MTLSGIANDFEANVTACKREIMAAGATLVGGQKYYGEKVSGQTIKAYGRLTDAHILITGVLGSALLRRHGKIKPITPSGDERIALFAAYVIGMGTCESAIAEGRYLQAMALLRQEMETLAQLMAVKDGKRNASGSPNVGRLEKSLRRLYSQLSDAAHLSNHSIIRSVTEWEVIDNDVPDQTSGTRYFPALDTGLARRSFGLHLLLTIWIISELSVDLYEQQDGDGITEREGEAILLAQLLMKAEGVIEIDSNVDVIGKGNRRESHNAAEK